MLKTDKMGCVPVCFVLRYEYDKQNRPTKTVSPDTGTTVYTYDLNGNLKTKKDAKDVTITYSYDTSNRLTTIDFATDTDIVYTYNDCLNGKGRACKMTDASGMTGYEYTAKGQVAKETKIIDGVTYMTEYGYDKNGNTKTMTYPSGRMITYTHSNDRVSSVLNNAANLASDITYKPFGGINAISYGNGIQQLTAYEQQYRISAITANTIQNLAYSYDFNGNITGITNNLDQTKNKTFTYDSHNRLKDATGLWGTFNYTYDGVGNRQNETANSNITTYSYTANKLNATTGGKTLTFGYDSNGNSITENTRQFTYNQNQRLIRVTENNIIKGEYVYNGNGQRVRKTTQSGTTLFHYSLSGQLVAETMSTGVTTAEYVFLNSNPLAKIEGGIVYYYHNDHLGTPQRMSDSTGAVVWEGEFLPFGEALSVSGTITNNLRFPGQYFDEETGLNYNYFRDYNPMIGRYVESDPIGIKAGMNPLYVYVGNNPMNLIDPFGLKGCGPAGRYCQVFSVNSSRAFILNGFHCLYLSCDPLNL